MSSKPTAQDKHPRSRAMPGRAATASSSRLDGDGTSYEILNGLFPRDASEETPTLAFLPVGTGNSFLREFSGSRRRTCAGSLACPTLSTVRCTAPAAHARRDSLHQPAGPRDSRPTSPRCAPAASAPGENSGISRPSSYRWLDCVVAPFHCRSMDKERSITGHPCFSHSITASTPAVPC